MACLPFGVVMVLTAFALPAGGVSFVFSAGNNQGLASDTPLRFAESDAVHVATALAEVGAAAPSNIVVARGLSIRRIEQRLSSLSGSVGAEDTVHLFFSAHGDRRGLHIDGEIWRWDTIKRRVAEIRAKIVVVYVDACQSGYLLSPKGFVSVPRQRIDTTAVGPKGRVIITSSGPTELSHESSLLESSPFAHALVSGIRGAADRNGDGTVTVSELYVFVLARSAAATIDAPGGPQHAGKDIRLAGTGEVVVAQIDRGYSRLYRGDLEFGTCYVLDADEEHVVTELRPTGTPFVPLVAGQYVVKCLDDGRVQRATIRIASRDTRLDSARFRQKRLSASLVKGQAAWRHRLDVSGGVLLDSDRVRGTVGFGYHGGPPGGGLSLLVGGSFGDAHPEYLGTLGVEVRLPWWQLPRVDFFLGIELGVKSNIASEAVGTTGALIGPYLFFSHDLSKRIALSFRLDGLTSLPFDRDGAIGFCMIAALGIAATFRREDVASENVSQFVSLGDPND